VKKKQVRGRKKEAKRFHHLTIIMDTVKSFLDGGGGNSNVKQRIKERHETGRVIGGRVNEEFSCGGRDFRQKPKLWEF